MYFLIKESEKTPAQPQPATAYDVFLEDYCILKGVTQYEAFDFVRERVRSTDVVEEKYSYFNKTHSGEEYKKVYDEHQAALATYTEGYVTC